MSGRERHRGSPLAISSGVLVVLAPLAAWLILRFKFPGGAVGSDAGEHFAVAILAVDAFVRSAAALFWLAAIGFLAGGASLVRAEPRRVLGIGATAAHAVLLLVVLAGVTAALTHLAE